MGGLGVDAGLRGQGMDIAEDIRRIKLQEERLRFAAFDVNTAWEVGKLIREAGDARKAPIVVDIQLWTMPLLSFALPGAAPENFDWARRKRNVVAHFYRSSYLIGRMLAHGEKAPHDISSLPLRDYAWHGGAFPIFVSGTGCVGAVAVSGLPERNDHMLVVTAIAEVLKVEILEMALD